MLGYEHVYTRFQVSNGRENIGSWLLQKHASIIDYQINTFQCQCSWKIKPLVTTLPSLPRRANEFAHVDLNTKIMALAYYHPRAFRVLISDAVILFNQTNYYPMSENILFRLVLVNITSVYTLPVHIISVYRCNLVIP